MSTRRWLAPLVGMAVFIGVWEVFVRAFHVRPFILRLQGVADVAPKRLPMRADFALPKGDRRNEFLRARINANGSTDTDFDPNTTGRISAVTLRGAGWGHGVGLCQMGALGMSLTGSDWHAICKHYYPRARAAIRPHSGERQSRASRQ